MKIRTSVRRSVICVSFSVSAPRERDALTRPPRQTFLDKSCRGIACPFALCPFPH